MLLRRVIPCLDVDKGRVVKGVEFVDLRDAGDPVELAVRYQDEGADEIVQPEFEAGLEFIRQVLGWQGIDAALTEDLVAARRETVYGARDAVATP